MLINKLFGWFRSKKSLIDALYLSKELNKTLQSLNEIKDTILVHQQNNLNRVMSESVQLLSAITLLNNGNLTIPKDFLEALTQDKTLMLRITKTDDGGVNLELVSVPQQEEQAAPVEEKP